MSPRFACLIVVTILAVTLLAGCHSGELQTCKAENAKLTQRVSELEAKTVDQETMINQFIEYMEKLANEVVARQDDITALQKQKDELQMEIDSKRIARGVEELKRMQQEAGARLTAKQAAEANKPK
jgi:SMC interacting uncharacterized protein involved in chromosome segregation